MGDIGNLLGARPGRKQGMSFVLCEAVVEWAEVLQAGGSPQPAELSPTTSQSSFPCLCLSFHLIHHLDPGYKAQYMLDHQTENEDNTLCRCCVAFRVRGLPRTESECQPPL